MPDDKKTAEAEPEVAKYDRDRLIAEAEDFFDQPSHVVAGALANADARRQSFSRDEVEKAITGWLKKPVGPEED